MILKPKEVALEVGILQMKMLKADPVSTKLHDIVYREKEIVSISFFSSSTLTKRSFKDIDNSWVTLFRC